MGLSRALSAPLARATPLRQEAALVIRQRFENGGHSTSSALARRSARVPT
jgi:hypothetical protein